MLTNRRTQILRESLKSRLAARGESLDSPNMREVEDAFQYGWLEALEVFDRMMDTGYSFYFMRTAFLSTALTIRENIVPELTEAHLRAFACLPGSSGVTPDIMTSVLQLIMECPDENAFIGSILKERKIVDPVKIMEIVAEQREIAGAFSSGSL